MKKKILATILAVVIGVSLVLGHMYILEAITSDSDTNVKSVHVSDSEIENSTLIIGTYLIHINGLSDDIYALAQDSAVQSAQNDMYYKSELASGKWYKITDATSIADITSEGTPVAASVIEALEFTHKVDADGNITDLRTGAAVDSYNVSDPYNMEELAELEPVKLRYDLLQEKETRSDSDNKNIEMIGTLYGLSLKDTITDENDARLSALEIYKNGLPGRGKPETWTAAVDTVIASVDAQRRVEALTILDDYLDQLLKKVTGQEEEVMTQEEYNTKLAEAETDEAKQLIEKEYQESQSRGGIFNSVGLNSDYQEDAELVSAISQARANVQESLTSYNAKIIVEGSTTTTKQIYKYTNNLISCASASDVSGADIATEKLVNLQNIAQGVIGDADEELSTLLDVLLKEALDAWKKKLSAGVSAEYKQAITDGASEAVKVSYLIQQKSDTNAAVTEYQSMLEEAWKRMSNAKAQQDVQDRINGIGDLEKLVPSDDAKTYQLETIAEHLSWLRAKLGELVAESSDSSELDTLKQQKDELETQRRDALDKNDLSTAKKLAAEIEAKQTDMDNLTKELTDVLNSEDSTEADKARALAGLTAGSTAKKLNSLASDITSGIRDSSDTTYGSSSLLNQMAAFSALSSYDPDAAASALAEIKDALDNASNIDADLKNQLGSEISELEGQIADASSTAGASGLSSETLKSLLADYFGEYTGNGTSSATQEQKAGALIALSMYAEATDNSDARAMASSLAGKMASDGNSYIYEQYDKDTGEYLSLKALGAVLGYRYIFDNAHYTVTLSKAQEYYLFTQDSVDYISTDKTSGIMQKAAGLMGTLYISSEDGDTIFDSTGYYIPKSIYASVRTSAMEYSIQEVYQMLMRGGN